MSIMLLKKNIKKPHRLCGFSSLEFQFIDISGAHGNGCAACGAGDVLFAFHRYLIHVDLLAAAGADERVEEDGGETETDAESETAATSDSDSDDIFTYVGKNKIQEKCISVEWG